MKQKLFVFSQKVNNGVIKEAFGIFKIAVLCHYCVFDQQRFHLSTPFYLFQITRHDKPSKPVTSGKLHKTLSEIKDEEVVKAVGRQSLFHVNFIRYTSIFKPQFYSFRPFR